MQYASAAGAGLALALILVSSEEASSATFTGVGDLPGGAVHSIATGLSADGSAVVGHSASASGVEAFRKVSGSAIEGLGDLPGNAFHSVANGTSADGSVVVGASAGSEPTVLQAFRWTEASQMVTLPDFWAAATFWHEATDVTADGAIIAGWNYFEFVSQTSFGVWLIEDDTLLWQQEAPSNHPLGQLVAPEVRAISADGSVWAGVAAFDVGPIDGIVWTAGGSVITFIEEGSGADVHGLSADGVTAVGALVDQAYAWTASTGVVLLGDLPGGSFASSALDASADGSIIVGYGTTELGTEAFVWDAENGMRHLGELLACRGAPATGWAQLSQAVAISDDATTVAGWGINPDGDTEAWAAELAFLAAACGGTPARLPAMSPAAAAILIALIALIALIPARARRVSKDRVIRS
jgi:probable HAF family extracellular repeat protein